MTFPAVMRRGEASDREGSERLSPSTPGSGRQPSTRYADQPMSWGTRLFGMGGVAAIVLLIAGVASISWRIYTVPQATATLSLFDVAIPAAPPGPPSEEPPGPEQVKKVRLLPEADMPRIKLPEIRLRNDNPIILPIPKPIPDPGPPVDDTTAPEAKALPPAPQLSTAKLSWEGLVLGALNKKRRYPPWSMSRREQGVPWIRFVIDREGKVLSSRLERSSGFTDLDREAIALPERASPLPKPPDDVKGGTIELVVPVEFFMR